MRVCSSALPLTCSRAAIRRSCLHLPYYTKAQEVIVALIFILVMQTRDAAILPDLRYFTLTFARSIPAMCFWNRSHRSS